MAYEKLGLHVTPLSGKIILGKKLKDGTLSMSAGKKDLTDEAIRSIAEWFMINEKVSIIFLETKSGKKPAIFFEDDPEKQKKIMEIINGK